MAISSIFWNKSEKRARALWRILTPLIPVLIVGTIVAIALMDRVAIPVLIFVVQLTLALAVFAAFTLGNRYLDRGRSIWDYGLRADRRWGGDVLAGVLIGVVAVAIPYLIGIATGWFEVTATLVPGAIGLGAGLILAGMAYLCTGFWEELVFRGVLMANSAEGLRRWFSRRNAVPVVLVLQAFIFGVIHINQWTAQAPHPAFVITWILSGFMFGLLYLLSNDLALPIGVHAAINTAEASLISETAPADSGWSVLVLVEPVSESILFGHGGIMMASRVVLAGLFGVLWLRYSRSVDLDLWIHPAFFVGEEECREEEA